MYGHPKLVKKMAKAFKPAPTFSQAEQARLMRLAKVQKREYLTRQKDLFEVVA